MDFGAAPARGICTVPEDVRYHGTVEEASPAAGGTAPGGQFLAAVTGSVNSEYLVRWTESAARRLEAGWTVLHVRVPGREEDEAGLARNLALARELGASVVTMTDVDAAACIVRYARIRKASLLVIGKAEPVGLPLLDERSLMDDILKVSGDLDVLILRGKTPVRRPRRLLGLGTGKGAARGIPAALATLAGITVLGLLGLPVLGYRAVSILYLLGIMALPFACGRAVVFGAAAASALLWDFLFIPPRLTLTIAGLEDILMFLAYFVAAFVGSVLTTRLKEKETALALRERRMAFLYGFTRAMATVRGIEEVAALARDYLEQHLGLDSSVLLATSGGLEPVGDHGAAPAHDAEAADRCFRTVERAADGDDRPYFPLGAPGSVLGVLFVDGGDERAARGETRELLAALADNLALALERERLAAENERNRMAGESERLSRILLNHVSHELRTPLTTITGSVSGLLDGTTADDPELRDALLSETLIAAERLDVLVEDLLAMSRLESGKLCPRVERVYLGELLGAARSTLGVDLAGRSVSMDEATAESEVDADPVLMAQVFRNVLRNFAAYTPAGSTLTVSAAAEPGHTVASFEDDGPGVPERELPLIFDTFYRGAGSASGQGCGLGLSICRGIVEAHGGSMTASRGARGGLLLSVRLPTRAAP